MNLAALFHQHVEERRRRAEEALAATGFDTLVLSSGVPYTYFADDENAPFHPVAHFAHWCPMTGPHHALVLRPGATPRLVRYAPEDYWYEQTPLGEPFWAPEFEISEAGTVDGIWKAVGTPKKAAYVGNEVERAKAAGLEVNPRALVSRLDWDRAYKTEYEIQCLDDATALGAKGHRAAKKAFEAGETELQIHYAYVRAMEVTEDALPYTNIVALNEKGAFLHYQTKRDVGKGKSLLIDAGARARGYASDITRTHVAPGCDPKFVTLRDGMERLQQELCRQVRPGVPFGDLHEDAHRRIAALLGESGILRATSVEEAMSRGLTRPFLPHGLGHHLGLQVHDVGGHMKDPEGHEAPPPPEYPYLRNTRTLEPRQVTTVEPGLYFIDLLLGAYREGEESRRFDWKLIDELSAFGGIRVEDNVVVTEDGHRNLTRERL